MNFKNILAVFKSGIIILIVLPFDKSIFCYNQNLYWR